MLPCDLWCPTNVRTFCHQLSCIPSDSYLCNRSIFDDPKSSSHWSFPCFKDWSARCPSIPVHCAVSFVHILWIFLFWWKYQIINILLSTYNRSSCAKKVVWLRVLDSFFLTFVRYGYKDIRDSYEFETQLIEKITEFLKCELNSKEMVILEHSLTLHWLKLVWFIVYKW